MNSDEDTSKDGDMESNSKGKRGRPKGMGRSQLEILKGSDTPPLTSKRSRTMSPSTTSGTLRQESRAAGTITKQKDPSSTVTRPFFFIVGEGSNIHVHVKAAQVNVCPGASTLPT